METDLKNYLLFNSLEGILITDLEGNILECNTTAHQMLGYLSSDLEGQFVGFVFPPQSVSHLLPNLLHLAMAGGGFKGDIILQNAFGDNVIVRLVAQAWPENNPAIVLLRFLDWRETHQIITQMRESSQMASLGTLTRSMSHELLNPLSIIGGYTKRLLDSLQLDSKQEEWARMVMASIHRLESMIETIETFLHLPSPSFVKGSLDQLITNSLEGIQEDAEKLGVRISREKISKTPQIFMDPDLLEKAFSAVLLNALDRMPRGGELTLYLNSDERFCQFYVEDSGPTLDTRQMEEDLSPIHVIAAHRTHLNLAIAKRIVDDHGGHLDIGRSHQEGLKVKIRLPTDRRALAREREM